MFFDHRVQVNNYRVRKFGLPSTLTQEQWKQTVDYFRERCAYCQVKYYEQLDHFVPIRKGGGTTWDNCVPACASCNTRKDHPKFVLLGDPQKAEEALARVKEYLDCLADTEKMPAIK